MYSEEYMKEEEKKKEKTLSGIEKIRISLRKWLLKK